MGSCKELKYKSATKLPLEHKSYCAETKKEINYSRLSKAKSARIPASRINAEINYSRPSKAKSGRIPAARMQKYIMPGLGKRNLLEFQHLECRK